MLGLTEVRFFRGVQTHFTRKNVQTVLSIVSCIAILGLVAAVVLPRSNKSSSSNSPVLLSVPAPGKFIAEAEPHITDPEQLTIFGPFQDQETLRETYAEEEGEQEEQPRGQIVRISGQGSVRGTVLVSRKGTNYNAFYKIPYARPPVGRYRFEPPQSPRRWFGIRDATVPGKECIQKEKYAPINIAAGEEDCLYLNVYTPKVPASRRDTDVSMPVMFYIHGGGPFGNGTRYGAKYFMDENVVLVTFEFRLGILGGFNLGTREYPGNLGNKDIIAALKWVQRNIARFGGDPKRVVIFGNSSGSAHVHMLLLSKMSEGLFHRAIMQSGSAIMNDIFVMEDTTELMRNFTVEVGCDRYWGNERRLLRCLRDVEPEKIVLTQAQLAIGEFAVENSDSRDAFITDTPWNLMQSGQQIAVPLIAGINSNEFAHVALSYLTGNVSLDENFDGLFQTIIEIPDDAEHSVAKRFRRVYFGNKTIGNDTRQQVFNLFSDKFAHSTRVTGMLHALKTGEPVYFYWLSKEAAKSYADSVRKVYPPPYGASHADELQYLFLYNDYPEIPVDSPWFAFSEMMVRLWVSYASEGRPISPTVEWNPIDLADDGMVWFRLDDELGYVEPFTDRMQLWDEYIDQLYGDAPLPTKATTVSTTAQPQSPTTPAPVVTPRVGTNGTQPEATTRAPNAPTTSGAATVAPAAPSVTQAPLAPGAATAAPAVPAVTQAPAATAAPVAPSVTQAPPAPVAPTAAPAIPDAPVAPALTPSPAPGNVDPVIPPAPASPDQPADAPSSASELPPEFAQDLVYRLKSIMNEFDA